MKKKIYFREIRLFVMISDWIDVFAIFANNFGVLSSVFLSKKF